MNYLLDTTVPELDPPLSALASRLVWWQAPDRTLADVRSFVARAMAEGTWEDMMLIRRRFGEVLLRDILQDAPPGIFDPRSWTYWHVIFGIDAVPPLPRRHL